MRVKKGLEIQFMAVTLNLNINKSKQNQNNPWVNSQNSFILYFIYSKYQLFLRHQQTSSEWFLNNFKMSYDKKALYDYGKAMCIVMQVDFHVKKV